MSTSNRPPSDRCPDCSPLPRRPLPTRRDVLKRAAGGALAASAASAGIFSLAVRPRSLLAAEEAAAKVAPASETLVAQLYGSLKEGQKKRLCFPFDHPLRLKVDNNWFITNKGIGDILDDDQQALVKQIFMGIHSEQYAKKVFDQVEHDGGGKGTFGQSAIALFGEPDKSGDAEKGKFEFVLTGRHCTRRCDGNSVAGAAFGGPIFYGHG